ncbi:AAA family ATPase [Burkholderia cenocepacia]
MSIRLAKPVALFTGPNGAGKSSLQEAVRMALTGDTVRVALKKEYGSLVTEGADGGQIVVACGEQANSVMLPSGKLKRELAEDPRLPLVLDAQRFAHLGAAERRAFLYDLMGVKIGVDEMRARLLDKLGLRADAVPAPAAARLAAITPMLRAGFEAAQKEAADRARGAKQSWRNATGETYGSQKAATWRPAPVEFDEAALRKLTGDRAALDDRIGELQQQIGAADAADTAARARASKIADLRTRAAGYPYSAILKCDLGAGCSECGGIGAVWDNTDYTAMGGAFERAGLLNGCDAPTPADERAAWDDTRHSLAVAMCGFASRAGNRDLDAAISVIDAITEAGSPLSWLRTARAYSANETGAEGVRAWETDDGRVISDAQKQQALRDGGASASSVQPFHIALGKISAAQAAEPVPRKAGYVLVPVEPTQAMLDRGYWPCTQGRGAKSVWGEMLRAIPAAPQPPAQADARIDVEAMLRACVPGGDICDPQRIADSIREWFDDHGAQADAREGLTDEQRDVLGGNFGALEQAEDLCRATGNDSSADGLNALSYVLRALLATRQPEPRAEVTGNGGAK